MGATTMTSITLCVCICFLLCCFKVTQGELALDCCLKVSHSKIPSHLVRGYQLQVEGSGCDISAVIFITRKGRNLCTPPGTPWVERLTAHLDKEWKRCRQRKRCRSWRF